VLRSTLSLPKWTGTNTSACPGCLTPQCRSWSSREDLRREYQQLTHFPLQVQELQKARVVRATEKYPPISDGQGRMLVLKEWLEANGVKVSPSASSRKSEARCMAPRALSL